MARQSDFTPREWEYLGDAALAACTAVAMADEGSGQAEADAIISGWRDAAGLFAASELVSDIIHTLDPLDRANHDSGRHAAESPPFGSILREAIYLCSEAVQIIAQRGTIAETVEYRSFVLHLLGKVASAGTGGLFGLGGGVSERERAVIREISVALSLRDNV